MHAHTRPPAAPFARRHTPRSLSSNKIGAAGAAALAKALATSQLVFLLYVHASLPPPCRCPHGCDSGCWHHPCALRLRPLLAPCRRTLRPPLTPATPPPLPCSHRDNNFGGKCGTGSDSPSGAKGALCDAWRAKHGDKAKFDSYGVMTVA